MIDTPTLPFDAQPELPKRPRRGRQSITAETRADAHQELQRTLGGRWQIVLAGLQQYQHQFGRHPTARELLSRLALAGQADDINSVRPRLTEMSKPEVRYVEAHEKRACKVSGKVVATWAVTQKGRAALKLLEESK